MQQPLRLEVLWSPIFEDNFLTWSNNSNLHLYKVKHSSPSEEKLLPSSSRIKLNEGSVADIVATNTSHEHRSMKCVAWHHGIKTDSFQQIIAIGHSNGKISLTNFDSSSEIPGLLRKEFVPKNIRTLNSLSWNRQFHQFLASGFDKAGKDHCLYVFDINKGTPASSLCYERAPTSFTSDLQTACEWSTGESVHSVEFGIHDPQTLLAGINNKQIKLYDLREVKSVNFVLTKAVFGICNDPWKSWRFASYTENIVHIWDMRNFERPVLTLADNTNKKIEKLSWCPTRNGFLGCVLRDNNSLRVFDIQQQGAGVTEDVEPTVIHRSVADNANSPLVAFAWHTTRQNRVLVSYNSGELVDLEVRERITLNWSAKNTLVWSPGRKCLQALEIRNVPVIDDISILMKERAINRYGLEKDNVALNGTMTGDATLQRLWAWMEEARRLTRDSSFRCPGGGPFRYHGIASLLNQSTLKSSISYKKWVGVEGAKIADVKTFISEERRLSLGLCFWNFEKESSFHSYLSRLESSGQHTRAAAIAVFNLHLSHAIHILQNAATSDPALHTTAMALAGYTSDKQALWRETSSAFLQHISDPYLKAAFAFLMGDAVTFDPILNENGVVVHDRVAFACKYLSDARLTEFVQSLKMELIEKANLDGILLTGLSSEGEDLLQRYIDGTGDVQTPALLIVHAMKHINFHLRLQNWVDSYRNLLDSLQLWKERVQVDVLKNQGKDSLKLPQQIHVSCTVCLRNISSYAQTPGRPRNPYEPLGGTIGTNKLKMTTCPNPGCRRPLPRCSLCLQHMGTPSKRGRNPPTDNSAIPSSETSLQANLDRSAALKQFSNWFTWCHSCRHGGHAQHMMQWFNDHMECPVASCTCNCKRIDDVNKIAPQLCAIKL